VRLPVSDAEASTRPLTVSVRLLTGAGEFDLANNAAGFYWIRLPDWSLPSGAIALGAPAAGTTPITITAYNVSDVSAGTVSVQVFSTHPDEGGALLWQGELAAADAWGRSRVSAPLPGAVARAYVHVNGAGAVAELSTANNSARSGLGFADIAQERMLRTFLPAVAKR
jgi:hypothetical protein